MRRASTLLPSLLALGLALGGCAAPPSDDVGEGQGAAAEGVSLDTSFSEEEQALLRGEGLDDCVTEAGDATLCRYANGVVVLSKDGVAILRADGDTVTAMALSPDRGENHDVDDVLASVGEPSSDLGTASLRPQGLAQVAGKVLVQIAEHFGAKAPRAATVAMLGGEAEVAAMRSATLAGDLRAFSASLPKGQFAERAASGVTQLGGATVDDAAKTAHRWHAVTKRPTIGMGLSHAGDAVSDEAVEMFFRTIVRPAKNAAKPGERLTLVVPTGMGNGGLIYQFAAREGVDIVHVGASTPPGSVVAHIETSQPWGEAMKAFADRVYVVSTRVVEMP